MRYIWLNILML